MSLCLLVTFASPAKTAEPVKMPFGKDNSREHKEPAPVFDVGRDPMEMGNFDTQWGGLRT